MLRAVQVAGFAVIVGIAMSVLAADQAASQRPDATSRPDSPIMLDLASTGTDPANIDSKRLPVLSGEHALVSAGDDAWQFRLHNYLAYFAGRYWCFWSHGPVIEDQARQHLQYSTSEDGLHWNAPQVLAGPPSDGYGYIARGFWIRNGELLALAALYEAPAYHDGDLELVAFRWDASQNVWQSAGRVFDNALNNFAPKKLASGEWMMSRRASDRSVTMLIGGVRGIDQWEVIRFSAYKLPDGTALEEPYWWTLPGGAIVGLFRDNSRSGRLIRSFSIDNGRTWSRPVRTNFPDATSKFHGLQSSRGYWVLVSNANPAGRSPLCLSVSPDGLVFTHLFQLPVPEQIAATTVRQRGKDFDTLQYPHVIEQDGSLHIAYSRNKQSVEVLKVDLATIDQAISAPNQ